MSVLTAEEITNIYLYGTKEKPGNLLDANKIMRPVDAKGEVTVDIKEYMQDVGRFVNAASFDIVDRFFTDKALIYNLLKSGKIEKGHKYSEIEMRELFASEGVFVKTFIPVTQKEYGARDSDYIERTYIWNSTVFEISDDTQFVILEDGTCQIENFAIIPLNWVDPSKGERKPSDNFDFISSDYHASWGGYILDALIDPLGIGRTVDMYFSGTPERTTINLDTYLDAKKHKPEPDNYGQGMGGKFWDMNLRLLRGMSELANELFINGSTQLLDGNRPIIYGSSINDKLSGFITHSGYDLSNLKPNISGFSRPGAAWAISQTPQFVSFLEHYTKNGITYVTGDGNDTIEGTQYNDRFIGGKGSDTYIVQNKGDIIVEKEEEGYDIVESYVSYELADNIEGLLLLGDALNGKGNDKNNSLRGNEWNNHLEGGAGNDVLIGAGGADRLEGGKDFDTYLADNLDTIFDSDGLGKVFLLNNAKKDYDLLIGGHWKEGMNENTFVDPKGNTYVLSGTTLIVNGGLKIENFVPDGFSLEAGKSYSKLGITLTKELKSKELTNEDNIERQQIVGEDDPDNKYADSLVGEKAGVNYHIQGKLGDDYLAGNDGKDSLEGGEGDDTLIGNAGNDILDGGEGDDYLKGGVGNDILIGGTGSNILLGGDGDDWLFATNKEEVTADWGSKETNGPKTTGSLLSGGDGEDTLVGSSLNDIIFAGKGNKLIYAGEGDDLILLNQTATGASKGWSFALNSHGYGYWINEDKNGNELISRDYLNADSEVINTVYTGAGNDFVEGSVAGQDIIYTGVGNDTVYAGRGNNLIFGEGDNDYIYGDAYQKDISQTKYTFSTVDEKGLGYGNDTLDGGDGKDTILGAGGDDVIYGGGGDDSLFGDHVSETLTAEHYGDDYIDGGDGNDVIYGGGGSDTILGGAGNDTIAADDSEADITIQGDDYVDGGEGDDSIYGYGGNDTLLGGIGNDSLCGGLGNDSIYGGEGDDYMLGDDNNSDKNQHGNDYMDGGVGKDSIWGMGGDDTLLGGDDDDYLDGGEGNNYLYGGTGNDTLHAVGSAQEKDHGNNYLDGGEGNDILISGSGSDTLMGGDGADQLVQFNPSTNTDKDNDYLDGGDGNDTLSALTGNNTLIGGKGNDVLVSDLAAFDGFKDIGVIANDYLDGGEGNDFLISAGGADTLIGGTGSDTYSIFLKEGNTVLVYDEAEEANNTDFVVINNTSLNASSTKIYLDNNSLVIETSQGKVLIANYSEIEYVQFNEGVISMANLLASIGEKINYTPVTNTLIEDQQASANALWQWTIPEDSFTDRDGDELTYAAYLADGSELPSWLKFDTQTGTFTGMAPEAVQLDIFLIAYDKAGAATAQSFTLNFDQSSTSDNHTPVANGELAHQKITMGENWQWSLPNDSFTDQDAGDVLTYKATLLDGSPLPSWLTFDSKTGSFSGQSSETTDLDILITAYDRLGASASHKLSLSIIAPQAKEIIGTANNDRLDGSETNDLIKGLAGNDSIYAGAGDDTIYTGEGYNYVEAGNGNDLILAGSGGSTVYGGLGNDTFVAGSGSASFYGDEGNDVYQIGVDWKNINDYRSNISILDSKGNNSIQFGEGISLSDFTVSRYGDSLCFTLKNDPNKRTVYIGDYFKNYNQTISFADGTMLTIEQIKQWVLQPTDGDDYLQGYEGDDNIDAGKAWYNGDTVKGGAGNDTLSSADWAYLYGEEGNDLLIAKLGGNSISMDGGSGDDVYFIEGVNPDLQKPTSVYIVNDDSQGTDIVKLAAGIKPSDFYIFQEGNNLKLAFKVNKYSRDSITLENYFSNIDGRVDAIVFTDGTTWDYNYIKSHITQPIDHRYSTYTDGASITGGIGNDYFDLWSNASVINGGGGVNHYNVTYIYGVDITASTVGQDYLSYGSLGNLEFTRNGNNLVINQKGFINSVVIKNHFTTNPLGYINGCSVEDALKTQGLMVRYEKLVLGDDKDNYFITGNGSTNETIRTFGGNDTLDGGYGDDLLEGGSGQDTYLFSAKGSGDDTIIAGESGLDIIQINDFISTDLLSISRNGNDLIIVYKEPMYGMQTGRITVKNHYTDGAIGKLDFSDGIFTVDQLFAMLGTSLSDNDDHIILTDANDKVHGKAGNDYIDGADGNDTLYGDAGDDTLIGGEGNDCLDGGIWNDLLKGGVGDDLLISKSGNDTLYGGQGNDTYDITLSGNTVTLYEEGDGIDKIILNNINYQDSNTKITQLANGVVKIKTARGTVMLRTDYKQFEYLQFADTTIATKDLIIEQESNNAPTAIGTLTNQTVEAGGNWQWSLPTYNIVDPDFDDELTYTATLIDGSPLPDGLIFDSNTATFTGRVSNTVGTLTIIITAYDNAGASAQQQLTLDINKAYAVNLTGTPYSDFLSGKANQDTLKGGNGDDTLVGSGGNDQLQGGAGTDSYLFRTGDGQDTITTGDNGIDTIVFEGDTANQIHSINRSGNHLIINYGNNDKITVTNHFTTGAIGYINTNNQIISIQDFINSHGGIVLSTAADNMTFGIANDLIYAGAGNDRISAGDGNDTLYGEAGNDSLMGGNGDDLLIGGIGNDTLTGDNGNDTYQFGRNDGQDIINNTSTTWKNDNDRLLFQQGINADQLWFQKSGYNLIVSVIGTTDKVTVTNWYRGDQYKLDSFELSNGESLLANQVDNLVNAMASFKPPVSGQTELPDDYHNKLDTVIAAGWN